MRCRPVYFRAILALFGVVGCAANAVSQEGLFRRTQVSEIVHIDEADAATRSHQDRIDAFLADQQWDEAVQTLRRIMEDGGQKLVALSDTGDSRDTLTRNYGSQRWVPVRTWGHLRLAMLANSAPEALALYRSRVDPQARQWYEEGLKNRDEQLLRRVVDEYFTSSFGDDALLALGELALERGDFTAARNYWEQLHPALRAVRRQVRTDDAGEAVFAAGRPLWAEYRAQQKIDVASLVNEPVPSWAWLAFPDSAMPLADARARLTVVSILEGDLTRAEIELALLNQLHPDAEGVLAGKKVRYSEALQKLLDESRVWPQRTDDRSWRTFAGNAARNKIAPGTVDPPGEVTWSIDLGWRVVGDEVAAFDSGQSPPIAERSEGLLYTHPVVQNGLLFFADFAPGPDRTMPQLVSRIRAYDLATGKPAWSGEGTEGVVRRSEPYAVSYEDRRRWGVPRLTLTAEGSRLFARLGAPVTSRPLDDFAPAGRDRIEGLNLARQGTLLWEPLAPDAGFAFEGTPISDGSKLYVALRRSQIPPQVHVACYDLRTGLRQWQRWVCGGESLALGRVEEVTHNLLTLQEETLYFNTNLGCVAALDAGSGKIKWLTRYPRSGVGEAALETYRAAHLHRDLNPCVVWRGMVLAAPTDSPSVMAFDAATGQLLWMEPADDVAHLLGVGEGNLIASGTRLWWFDAVTGRTVGRYPLGREAEPHGYGRGVLAGSEILWPTKSQIFVFEQGQAKQVRQPIELVQRGISGGHLVVADDWLIITAAEKLHVLRRSSAPEGSE